MRPLCLLFGLILPFIVEPSDGAVPTCFSIAVPQQEIIDGPGEAEGDPREFELNESDFSALSESNPGFRKRVELVLGVVFLVAVVLLAMWRRGKKS